MSDDIIKFIDKKFNVNTDIINSFCKKFNLSENTYLDILKLIMKGDLSFDSIKEDEILNNDSDKIKDFIEKSNLEKYCKQNYLNYEILTSAIVKSYSEQNKLNNDFSENIKKLKDMTVISNLKTLEEKVIKCYTMSYFHNIYYIKNGDVSKYVKNLNIELGSTLLKNMSTMGFYLNNNKKANILTNITKDILIDVAPFLILFQTKNNSDYYNYKDLEENVSELTRKLTDFSENKTSIKIDNLDIEDKNFLNILMKQVIEKPKAMAGGGYSQYIGKISKNLLKTKAFDNILNDVNLDNFSYGYVNLTNTTVKGLNLIKQKENNCIVKVVINDEYLNKYTKTRLLNRNQGYILK